MFHCGPPKKLLADNGSQFASKFLKRVCKTLGIHKVFAAECHPQTNGQTERHNRTTAAQLRDCVSDSQKDWDEWPGSLTCGCNSHVHKSAGTAPFQSALARKPPSISAEFEESDEAGLLSSVDRKRHMAKAKAKFLLTLEGIFAKARSELAKAQACCKKAHDKTVKPFKQPIQVNSCVCRHVPEHPQGVNPKPAQQSEGPHKVLKNDGETIIIDAAGNPKRVNTNRVAPAPLPKPARDCVPPKEADEKQVSENISENNLQPEAPESTLADHSAKISEQEFEADKSTAAGHDDEDKLMFKVRWKGCLPSDDAWEPEDALPKQSVQELKKKHRLHKRKTLTARS